MRCCLFQFGFSRLACSDADCSFEHLVAYSCKCRGVCGSCIARPHEPNRRASHRPGVARRALPTVGPYPIRRCCGLSSPIIPVSGLPSPPPRCSPQTPRTPRLRPPLSEQHRVDRDSICANRVAPKTRRHHTASVPRSYRFFMGYFASLRPSVGYDLT